MKIKAAVFYGPGQPFKIEALDLDDPHENEVLVKIVAVGVCHSDWHLMTGATSHPLPVVPGHEGAGIVISVGAGVKNIQPGDHVALSWAPSCGHCFYCLHEKPSLCQTYLEPIWAGTMMDGTPRLSMNGQPVYHFSALACFAEYAVVPQVCCVPIPKEIPLTIAALIGCAVTTGVGAVLNTARVQPGSNIAVFGAGGVGLSIILGARLAGASRIIAVDRHEAKGMIAGSMGATDYLPYQPTTHEQIKELTEGRGVDYAFEAVGLPEIQEACFAAARPGGTIVFAGLSAMDSNTNLPGALITRQEKTIAGSYYGSANPARDFPLYASLYLRGLLDLEKLVSRTYPLEEINEAYADMLSGEIARGLVVF